jgi:DNA-binding CsgD family transcriptional regulator
MLVITPQERDALQMLADGTPPEVIARRLGMTARDAEATVRALFAKQGSSTRSEALAEAVRRGLVSPAPVAPLETSAGESGAPGSRA